MTKRKVFKNGAKLMLLLEFHYETFNYTDEDYKERFNTEKPVAIYGDVRALLIEVAFGYWIEMWEYQQRMTFGLWVKYQGILYEMPTKEEMKIYLNRYVQSNNKKQFKSFTQDA